LVVDGQLVVDWHQVVDVQTVVEFTVVAGSIAALWLASRAPGNVVTEALSSDASEILRSTIDPDNMFVSHDESCFLFGVLIFKTTRYRLGAFH
jgi:hypothetical protein